MRRMIPKLSVRDTLILLESEVVAIKSDDYCSCERPCDIVSGEALNMMRMLSDEVLNRHVNSIGVDFGNHRVLLYLEDKTDDEV